MSNIRAIGRCTQHRACKRVSGGECRYFTYNDVNLVEAIEYPGGVANYFWYDAMMRRYAMQDSAGLRYFTWDANGMNLLAERDASGGVTTYYTHGYSPVPGVGTMIAAKRNEAGTSYYQYPVYGGPDGDLIRVVDENGTPTAYYEYDAWGNVLREDVVAGTGSNRFRANSNYIDLPDSGGGLDLSPTRVRHKATGAFLSRDPEAQLAGSYEYALNMPVTVVDPTGLQHFDPSQCNDPPYKAKRVTNRQKDACLSKRYLAIPALRDALIAQFKDSSNQYPLFSYWKKYCQCTCDNYARWAELMSGWEKTFLKTRSRAEVLRLLQDLAAANWYGRNDTPDYRPRFRPGQKAEIERSREVVGIVDYREGKEGGHMIGMGQGPRNHKYVVGMYGQKHDPGYYRLIGSIGIPEPKISGPKFKPGTGKNPGIRVASVNTSALRAIGVARGGGRLIGGGVKAQMDIASLEGNVTAMDYDSKKGFSGPALVGGYSLAEVKFTPFVNMAGILLGVDITVRDPRHGGKKGWELLNLKDGRFARYESGWIGVAIALESQGR